MSTLLKKGLAGKFSRARQCAVLSLQMTAGLLLFSVMPSRIPALTGRRDVEPG
jgi:hypothetical protein